MTCWYFSKFLPWTSITFKMIKFFKYKEGNLFSAFRLWCKHSVAINVKDNEFISDWKQKTIKGKVLHYQMVYQFNTDLFMYLFFLIFSQTLKKKVNEMIQEHNDSSCHPPSCEFLSRNGHLFFSLPYSKQGQIPQKTPEVFFNLTFCCIKDEAHSSLYY